VSLSDALLFFSGISYEIDAPALGRIPQSRMRDSASAAPFVRRVGGAVWSRNGELSVIPPSPISRERQNMMALAYGPRAADVVWSTGSTPAESLWYARLANGSWTAPEAVEAGWIFWSGNSGQLIRRLNGKLALIAPHIDAYGIGGVVLATHNGSQWEIRHFPTGQSAPAYVRAVELEHALIVLFLAGTQGGSEPDQNSVWTATIVGDSTMSAPVRIKFSGRGSAWNPYLLRLGDGSIHALWRDQAPDSVEATAVAHFELPPGTRVWKAQPSLATGPITEIDARADEGHSLRVVARRQDGSIITTKWRQSWDPIVDTELKTTSHVRLVVLPNGKDGVTFVGRAESGLQRNLPATWLAHEGSCSAHHR